MNERSTLSETLPATHDAVMAALGEVMDPEIPTISLVDLGVITRVEVAWPRVHVVMTPTFTGCPAMDYMQREVRERLERMGFSEVLVEMNFDTPWSTNRLTDTGRAALLQHGLAAPAPYTTVLDLTVLNNTACPFCGSHNTELRSPFGPTLCRSLHYCHDCLQGFEGFKPV